MGDMERELSNAGPSRGASSRQAALGQYPTPGWVAQALFERYFAQAPDGTVFCEPACGPGAFLGAIPSRYEAFGVEIDPAFAAQARALTGRPVIEGDFCETDLARICGQAPSVFLGNPPFQMKLIDRFLERIHQILPEGGQAGFVLPAYAFQTAARVDGYSKDWSIAQEMIPRNIYPGLRLPLVFALFTKERVRRLVGFALYAQASDVLAMPPAARESLQASRPSVWFAAVANALRALGGRASLPDLYAWFAPRRPTATVWWKEKVRQTLARHACFENEGAGVYALVA